MTAFLSSTIIDRKDHENSDNNMCNTVWPTELLCKKTV